jgi:hypothetical protein
MDFPPITPDYVREKWGTSRYVITVNATNAWCSFEMRRAFLQRSSSCVYPGFFKTPQIGVGPHDNQKKSDNLLAEKSNTNAVGLVTRQLLK